MVNMLALLMIVYPLGVNITLEEDKKLINNGTQIHADFRR